MIALQPSSCMAGTADWRLLTKPSSKVMAMDLAPAGKPGGTEEKPAPASSRSCCRKSPGSRYRPLILAPAGTASVLW
ncbi:MAG: hypothetical protein EBZ53_07635 [Verrucomicrobia bacterium]|nr:hypothetical protein [Verrucomicrobiota bacterium]